MRFLVPLLALVLGGLGIFFALWLWNRRSRSLGERWPRALLLLLGGAAMAVLATGLERWGLGLAGASTERSAPQGASALLAVLVFSAPLEEALKVAVIWPLYVRRRIHSGAGGALDAALIAAGFAACELMLLTWFGRDDLWILVRGFFAVPAHLFFAGVWGYTLGARGRDRFFGLAWIVCVLLHGLYDHIVFDRGLAFLVAVIPMLLLMGFSAYALLREPQAPSSGRKSAYSIFEPPSVGSVREALSRDGRPLKVHWILLGAFVNLGVTLVFLGLAVYSGHRFGVDFSMAESAGVEGILPIALLGSGLLASFPVSAYFIARASGTASVLEPAWATGASIIVVLALFSVTEPTALVIAAGIAPVGFTLACAGAWFGLERG